MSLEYKEHREYKVWSGFPEQKDNLEIKENLDQQWQGELRESQANKDYRDIRDHQDHQDHKDQRERGEQKEDQEQGENKEH